MPDFSMNFVGPMPRLRGRNDNLGASEICLNELGVLVDWATVFAADHALDITSSSANDDGAPLGTGAQTIEIYGLDKDWNFQKETIILNGTTIVTTAKKWRRVFEIVVQTAGTLKKNAGDIYVVKTGTGGSYTTPGVPGTLTSGVLKAMAGDNYGLSGLWTIPRGKCYNLASLAITSRGNTGTVKLWHGFPNDNGLSYPSIKAEIAPIAIYQSASVPLLVFEEKEDVYLTILGSPSTTFVAAELRFLEQGKGI